MPQRGFRVVGSSGVIFACSWKHLWMSVWVPGRHLGSFQGQLGASGGGPWGTLGPCAASRFHCWGGCRAQECPFSGASKGFQSMLGHRGVREGPLEVGWPSWWGVVGRLRGILGAYEPVLGAPGVFVFSWRAPGGSLRRLVHLGARPGPS